MRSEHPQNLARLPAAELVASRMLQAGLVICVLAIIPGRVLGVCLCNAPKELVLEVVGLTAAALCLFRASRLSIDYTDLFLIVFLALSIASASLVATDRWEALRAVGITAAGVAVFWCARSLANSSRRQPLLDSAMLAIVLVAAAVVLDALGYADSLSYARPGGTQGSRNWAAHLLAVGMPLLALQSLQSRSARRTGVAIAALAISTAALVMTRSRAAWIAVLLGTALPLAILGLNPRRFHPSWPAARVMPSVYALVGGVILGVCIPTQLHWRASHPYLETLRSIAAYDRGSGRGRLEQYRRSLAILDDHKALGVGPGNWKIIYPATVGGLVEDKIWYVPTRPNSDWIGFAVERGAPAFLFLVAALMALAIRSCRSLISSERPALGTERRLQLIALMGVLISVGVVGSFDAVLQLPAPSYLVFLSLGALAPPQEPLASFPISGVVRTLATLTVLLFAGILAVFTLNETYTSYLIARGSADDLVAASRLALDAQWFHTRAAWSERARGEARGIFPGCD